MIRVNPIGNLARRPAFGMFVVLSFAAFAESAFAQDLLEDHLWVTNKRVQTMERIGDTLYIGGNFTYVGPATGPGASFDLATGEMNSDLASMLGYVEVVEPDGDGGWYIGGEFAHVDDASIANLVHIASDGGITPLPKPNNRVAALLLNGDTLYIGGSFSSVGGTLRRGAAALDVGDPAAPVVLPWNPMVSGSVSAFELTDDAIILGGNFQLIGGVSRKHLAAVNPVSAELLPLSHEFGSLVKDVSRLGSTLYVCGYFTEVDGHARRYIAAVSLTSGELLPWSANPSGAPSNILATESAVFISGTLSSVNFVQRNGIAALDPVSAELLPWDADLYPNSVQGLWLSEETNSLYAVGSFTRAGDVPRHRIAELDLDTAELKPLEIHAGRVAFDIARSGNNLFVGGLFNSAGGVVRTGAAALDMKSGKATEWDMKIPFGGAFRMKSGGDTLFVSGAFNTVGSGQVRRNHVAEVDLVTGEPTEWLSPEIDSSGINALEVTGDYVYIGGGFRSIDGVAQAYLAELDRRTGALSRPFGGIGAIGPRVFDLLYDSSDNTLYVAGSFIQLAGVLRSKLAALDVTTGTLTDWDPDVFGSNVRALASRGDDVLYFGGNFTRVGGRQIENAAAVLKSTGEPIDWHPSPGGGTGSTTVLAMAVDDSAVYMGGSICWMGGEPFGPRCHAAAVHPVTGDLLDWFPGPSGRPDLEIGSGWAYDLMLADERVYVGGAYLEMLGVHRGGIGIVTGFNQEGGGPPVADITPDSFTFELETGNSDMDNLYIGNSGDSDLEWQIAAKDEWLGANPDSGVVPSGGIEEVTVTVDASMLEKGDYGSDLMVATNASAPGQVTIPITLIVTDTPPDPKPGVLVLVPGSLDFGDVLVGDLLVLGFEVANAGGTAALDLELAAIGTDGETAFQVAGGSCTIGTMLKPGESCGIEVSFSPDHADGFDSAAIVSTTDGQTGIVSLNGAGVEPGNPDDGVFSDRFEH